MPLCEFKVEANAERFVLGAWASATVDGVEGALNDVDSGGPDPPRGRIWSAR